MRKTTLTVWKWIFLSTLTRSFKHLVMQRWLGERKGTKRQDIPNNNVRSLRIQLAAGGFPNPSVFRSVNPTRFFFLHNRLEIQCRSICRKGRTRIRTYKRGAFFSIVCYKSEAGNCTIIPSKWRVEDTWKAPKAHKKGDARTIWEWNFQYAFQRGFPEIPAFSCSET